MADELKELIQEFGKFIRIYVYKEQDSDYVEEHNKTLVKTNPIPIKALVSDLTTTQAQWKMYGVQTSRAKEIICDAKYLPAILLSHKIEIDGEDYIGWKYNNKLQYRTEGNYIRLYVYSK